MILNPTSRRPTRDPDPSVSWSALRPHGKWVTWSQVMFEVPQPGCETAACSGVSSARSTMLGRDETPPDRWAGNPTGEVPEQSNSRDERTTR